MKAGPRRLTGLARALFAGERLFGIAACATARADFESGVVSGQRALHSASVTRSTCARAGLRPWCAGLVAVSLAAGCGGDSATVADDAEFSLLDGGGAGSADITVADAPAGATDTAERPGEDADRPDGALPRDAVDEPAVETAPIKVEVLGTRHTGDCRLDEGTSFALEFNVFDVANVPLVPGSMLNGEGLASRDTADLTFANVAIYPAPDVFCESDRDCSALPGDFRCRSFDEEVTDAPRACALPASVDVSAGSVAYAGQADSRPGSVLLAIANGSSILGLNERTGEAADRFSTDPDNLRISSAVDFFGDLQNVFPQDESRACLTWFTGEGSESLHFIPTPEECLQPLVTATEEQRAELLRITLTGEGVDLGQRSNWAVLRVAEEFMMEATSLASDCHIVLFTDGPDNGSNAPAHQTPEFVTELAEVAQARIHIVQLDNPWDGDEDGPIEALEEVACATAGTYLYARAPEGLERWLHMLVPALVGRYSVGLSVPELNALPAGSYRLSAEAQFDVHGSLSSVRLVGAMSDPRRAPVDSRLVLRRR